MPKAAAVSKGELARLRAAAPLFFALGDETRIQILSQLSREGPGSIVRLSEQASLSRQSVTKHLLVLERAGLIRGEKQGREHVWELQAPRLREAQDYLEYISRQWDAALERLREFVE